MDFLERHQVWLRLKIFVFGFCGTLFDIGSDLYNGILYILPKNVTRTIPEWLDVPAGCNPAIGAVSNETHTCLEVDLWWGAGSIALLQVLAVVAGVSLGSLFLLDANLVGK